MDLRAKSAASLPRHNLNEEDFNRPASASNAMGENSDPQKAPTMKMTDAFQHSVSSLEDSKTSGEKSTAQMKIINDRADAFIDEIFEKRRLKILIFVRARKQPRKKRKQKIHEKKRQKF